MFEATLKITFEDFQGSLEFLNQKSKKVLPLKAGLVKRY